MPVVVRGLMLVVLLALGGCTSLLFYPEPGLPITPERAGIAYKDVALQAADGTRLHAWWLPVPDGTPVKGTVLYLHGNGGNLAWHLGGTYWLPEQGYQVLMLDYRGYGLSEGAPSLPAVYQDIEVAVQWLVDRDPARETPMLLLAQSLGGALAVRYLRDHPQTPFDAVVLDGTPASFQGVARHLLAGAWLTWPLQWPLSWVVSDRFSAIDAVAGLPLRPLLIFHSRDDQVVPFTNGLQLYRAAQVPRRFIVTSGVHVHTFNDARWRQALLEFFAHPQAFVAQVPRLNSAD